MRTVLGFLTLLDDPLLNLFSSRHFKVSLAANGLAEYFHFIVREKNARAGPADHSQNRQNLLHVSNVVDGKREVDDTEMARTNFNGCAAGCAGALLV
jgi:hypothetical protein